MLRCTIYIFLVVVLTNCEKDKEVITPLEPECFGSEIVGTWSVVDSIEKIFLNVDSVAFGVFKSNLILYDNGIGNWHSQFSTIDNFFAWNLQCDPDIFTMSSPINNEDSLFNPLELYSVTLYDILVNENDYKKMRRERIDTIPSFKLKHITIRNLTRE